VCVCVRARACVRVCKGTIVSQFEVLAGDSSFGIAIGWTVRARFSAEEKDSTFFCSVQTDSGVHPASCLMFTGGNAAEV
jgi:hypothetical protein